MGLGDCQKLCSFFRYQFFIGGNYTFPSLQTALYVFKGWMKPSHHFHYNFNILVMNDGSVIEQGTHAELMAKKGFYYNLYNSQFAR